MSDEASVSQWILGAKQGQSVAVQRLWERYFARLVALARQRLHANRRRTADEEDVALSAMQSFFAGAREGRLAPKDGDETWKLLATIAVRKASAQLRRHCAAKRGGGNVQGDSAFDVNQVAARTDDPLAEISPHLGVACGELLGSLPEEDLQQIALYRLAGHTNDEIAAKLG